MWRTPNATPPASQAWRVVFNYNHFLNQEFARTYAVASPTAIVLWSASILGSRTLARGVALYGLLLGPVIVIAVLSGHVPLNVHVFGLIVLVQAVWFIVVGALLWRVREP